MCLLVYICNFKFDWAERVFWVGLLIVEEAVLVGDGHWYVGVEHVILQSVIVLHRLLNEILQVVQSEDVLETLHPNICVGVLLEEKVVKDQ